MSSPNPQNPSHTHRVVCTECRAINPSYMLGAIHEGTCADPNCREEEALKLIRDMVGNYGRDAKPIDRQLWQDRAEALLASRRKEAGG